MAKEKIVAMLDGDVAWLERKRLDQEHKRITREHEELMKGGEKVLVTKPKPKAAK